MEYKTYVCRTRARFKAICGQVNIPYVTTLNGQGGFLILNDLPVCSATSQNAYDFFTQNDDGMGQERGELLNRIIPKLEKRDAGYQARWGKIWEDALCQKYKRPDQEEHWIWNFDFYNGPVEDLRHIAVLIGGLTGGESHDNLSSVVLDWCSHLDFGGIQIPVEPNQA